MHVAHWASTVCHRRARAAEQTPQILSVRYWPCTAARGLATRNWHQAIAGPCAIVAAAVIATPVVHQWRALRLALRAMRACRNPHSPAWVCVIPSAVDFPTHQVSCSCDWLAWCACDTRFSRLLRNCGGVLANFVATMRAPASAIDSCFLEMYLWLGHLRP